MNDKFEIVYEPTVDLIKKSIELDKLVFQDECDICDIDTTLGMTFSERITSVKLDFKNGEVNVTASFGEDENPLGSMVREYVNALL